MSLRIDYALPLGSESRWSDMLATLVATDPEPLCRLLNLNVPPGELSVRREVAVDTASRPDLVLVHQGARVAVIEVKVLAGLGVRQLQRYHEADPDAQAYAVIFPERLTLDLADAQPWRGLTWEQVLDSYTRSGHSWVAPTAQAWAAHLDASLPVVGSDTVWNHLTDGEDFVIALRARMAWLYSNYSPPGGVDYDLVESSAGVSWVLRQMADTPAPGYQIVAEVEENLPVRDYPKYHSLDNRAQPRGPSAKVVLMQSDVTTSAGFNWEHLLALWPTMSAARQDWVSNAARPRAAHDREGHRRIVEAGAPPYVGIGFGEAQAKINHACMFGARVQFPPHITLQEMIVELRALGDLVQRLASVQPPGQGQE